MKIKTNNHPRDLLSLWELTEKERCYFDYVQEDDGALRFVRYRGWVYDTHEYMRIDKSIAQHSQREGWENWQGYASDSFFSGTLLRFVDNGERVVMATYYC